MFMIRQEEGLPLHNSMAIKMYIAKNHWNGIKEQWEKKESGEIHQRDWAKYVHDVFDKVELHQGVNHTRFARRCYDEHEQEMFTILYPNVNDDVVWINGGHYNHLFIKLGKASLKDLEDFLKIL